jgi:hypothetical protein
MADNTGICLFLAVMMLAVAWPILAVGALVFGVFAGRALRSRQKVGGWRKAGWRLTVGMAFTAMAAYGYGLSKLSDWGVKDPEDRCMYMPEGFRQNPSGSSSMWPLHDTRCGPELIPSFITPVVAASVALFLICAVTTAVMKVRSRREPVTSAAPPETAGDRPVRTKISERTEKTVLWVVGVVVLGACAVGMLGSWVILLGGVLFGLSGLVRALAHSSEKAR